MPNGGIINGVLGTLGFGATPTRPPSLVPCLLPQMTADASARAAHAGNERVRLPLLTNVIRERLDNHAYGEDVRIDQNTGKPRDHWGWDLEARVGTPCYAVATGYVTFVAYTEVYGWQLCMSFWGKRNGRLPEICYAFYAHLREKPPVEPWQRVTSNMIVGWTGKTGHAVNMKEHQEHLHFETRTVGTPLGAGEGGRFNPSEIYGFTPLYLPRMRDGDISGGTIGPHPVPVFTR